ncbi:MAG TPA: DUF4249 domain-containing protein [Chitinophagaceae bacterium]|nr:DUF4249 domain-containing protein [Chitinophagaceae bacterium]
MAIRCNEFRNPGTGASNEINMKGNGFLVLGFLEAAACLLAGLEGCVTPFNPPPTNNNPDELVVEGLINVNGPTTVQLSRTRSLRDSFGIVPESGAQVSVEDVNGSVYPLFDEGSGNYTMSSPGGISDSLRLNIITTDGNQYQSDFQAPVPATPIDSISWKIVNGNLQIYANTHGPEGATDYYLWRYEETLQFHSYYKAFFLWQDGQVVPLPPGEDIYTCWKSDYSTNILLGTSSGLSQNVVDRAPLVTIPDHAQQLSVLYSILVHQYALGNQAFQFWTSLRANTEQLGTIFDPVPSTGQGNLVCVTHPEQKVIGYVSVGSEVDQRIFISKAQMPMDWNQPPGCPLIVVPDGQFSFYFGPSLLPITQDGLSSFYGSYPPCVDCTTIGSNVKPSFWP